MILKGNRLAEIGPHLWLLALFNAVVLAVALKRVRKALDCLRRSMRDGNRRPDEPCLFFGDSAAPLLTKCSTSARFSRS